jgi:hypothetical protein
MTTAPTVSAQTHGFEPTLTIPGMTEVLQGLQSVHITDSNATESTGVESAVTEDTGNNTSANGKRTPLY